MNSLPTGSAGVVRTTGTSVRSSIGANAAFWAALRALPVDFEDETTNEICRGIVEAVDAHTATLQARLEAQASELAGLRARQVHLVCASADKSAEAVSIQSAEEVPVSQIDLVDPEMLAQCEDLAKGLTHNAGTPANTIAARKLFALIVRMREASEEALRAQNEDPVSQLSMSFAKRHQSYDSFQNHSHRYLSKRLGAGEANDTVGCSLRLLRAAAIVAREFTVRSASMIEVVTAICDVKPMTSKADAVAEALIALASVASAGRLHLDSIGDERLAGLNSVRTMPAFYSEKDLLPIPF